VIRQIVLHGLQRTLNHYVGESTAARDLLAELEGSSLAVEVAGLGIQCVLAARGEAIIVAETVAEPPSARLRAAPLDLLTLMRSAGPGGMRATQAEVTGDLHVAETFATLLKLARPDLEEELSHWVGDVAARELGLAAAGAVAWLERAGAALEMNAAEFLQDERRALPAALEAQAFYADVERLRDDVERVAARLKQLEQRRAAACAASD
jgi:ubiquinone biosynthesis accessory factor UbiJ